VAAPVLRAIKVAADPAAWAAAGFSVETKAMAVDSVTIEFVDAGNELVWGPTGDTAAAGPATHPNGVTEIDHVVMLAPRLEQAIDALEEEGIELRRIREGETGMGRYRQAFFRLGRPILEVVEASDMEAGEPPRFWGITFTTADIDASARLLGDKLGRIKDAVQPGQRIATVRTAAGLGLPVALISPQPPR
jgi:hypothetical protein